MAKELGIKTLAEGVETEEQFRKLLEAVDDLPEAEARVLMTELREKLWDHNVNAVDWEKEAAIQSALVVLEKNGIREKVRIATKLPQYHQLRVQHLSIFLPILRAIRRTPHNS